MGSSWETARARVQIHAHTERLRDGRERQRLMDIISRNILYIDGEEGLETGW